MPRTWRIELPPSLGREPARARARELASLLDAAGVTEVSIAPSYEALERRLLAGDIDLAWAPPLTCAAVEREHGRVALRSLRDGAASYRAVLVARRGDRLELTAAGLRSRRPRAVWVDPRSMGGFVLARALVTRLVGDEDVLAEERFVGTYGKALDLVLDGDADLTATFASTGNVAADGYVALAGERAIELRVVGYSAECPNDGIALSPRLPAEERDALGRALVKLVENPPLRAELARAFAVTGFEEPPQGSYVPLLTLHADALRRADMIKEAG